MKSTDGRTWTDMKMPRQLTEQEKAYNAAAERKAAQEANVAKPLPGTPINVMTGEKKETTTPTASQAVPGETATQTAARLKKELDDKVGKATGTAPKPTGLRVGTKTPARGPNQ
jgi:hypothetical protein